MKEQEKLINNILADWNPIGVPESVSKIEYINYISILKSKDNVEEIVKCLEDILINKMELEYDKYNSFEKTNLEIIAKKILLAKALN